MLSKEQIKASIKDGRKSQALDGRDYGRLVCFFDVEDFGLFGAQLKEGATFTPKEFTRENIISQLKSDVEFGFEKALNQRGISSSLMHEVVKMWMWVLEDELQHHDDYPMYGLPLFKAVAVKYGFKNEIGDDSGSEDKYGDE